MTVNLEMCWAKTDPLTGLPALTVGDHCLAVGMVAAVLSERSPHCVRKVLPVGASMLVASHDIGKITPGFLLKAAGWTFDGAMIPQFYERNHAKVSQAFLARLPEFRRENGAPFQWVLSAGGHHGKYPSPHVFVGECEELGLEWPERLRHELLAELIGCFGPLPKEDVEKGPLLHAFTGFTSFADWIGSDLNWFPLPCDGILKSRMTQAEARRVAETAVEAIGWHQREVKRDLEFGDLFSGIQTMRPLQESLVAAMDRPGLYVVEAPMGEGKTEAALAGAYRRWSSGEERGLYFALPTQLTSSRIHDRVEDFLKRVIDDPVVLTLVHGNAWLDPRRVSGVVPLAGTETVSFDMLEWYASGRKAMLAAFGTGTIDQALMSTLPVKHSGLRLFSLVGKVVVMDEVHSYDPYTSALVDRTVKWLLEFGGTVIVLSATLSEARRRSLLEAAGVTDVTGCNDYPLITRVVTGSGIPEFIPVAADPERSREVRVELTVDEDALLEEAVTAAEDGACVLIIRNTVALAQETYRRTKALCRDQGVEFGLLHSRFPQFQRNQSEAEWMEKLGKSGGRRPAGCILVATQVVEQSVDIDADLLVTDLAPMDAFLQRLGRLHRHQRSRPGEYEEPRCKVLLPILPMMESTAKEFQESLGASAFVYPPASLLMAYQVLSRLPGGHISLPRDIRPLVEAGVTPPENLFPALEDLLKDQQDKVARMLGRAGVQDVFSSPPVDDREGVKTRWNERPTAMLVLLARPPERRGNQIVLRFLNGREVHLVSGNFHYGLALRLHENAVRIPLFLVRGAVANQPDWLRVHLSDGVLAVVAPEGAGECELTGKQEAGGYLVSYHPETGITHSTASAGRESSLDPEEEGWF